MPDDDDGMVYCDEHVPDGDPGVHVFVYEVDGND
jgi:hypothetical protein